MDEKLFVEQINIKIQELNEIFKKMQDVLNNLIPDSEQKKPLKLPFMKISQEQPNTQKRTPSKEELYGSDNDLYLKNEQFKEKLKNVKSSGYGQKQKPQSQVTNSLGERIQSIKWTNAVKLPRTKKTMPPLSCPNKKNEFNGRYL